MPNWCMNEFVVSGRQDRVDRFLKAFKGKPPMFEAQESELKDGLLKEMHEEFVRTVREKGNMYCFNALVPVPKKILKQGFDMAGYSWCVDTWGSKWDVWGHVEIDSEELLEVDGVMYKKVRFSFDTAWGPPLEWLKVVAQIWFEVRLELLYWEPGMGFAGEMIWEGGVMERDDQISCEDSEVYVQFVKDKFGAEVFENMMED